ncbi:MAG: TonB-dependent receptor [Elusimicrobia bacterium]|nr:TonB-dependent receptor [Elusimicrobiota bacterium]
MISSVVKYPSAAGPEEIALRLPDVMVVGSRTGGGEARDIDIYTKSEFEGTFPVSADDIIGRFSPVYLRNRGAKGVLQDIDISAASYEQSLVLFDGVPVNDPQTGHFSMNIPVPPSAIERLEVLNGHGSVSHGSGAMGGVINIVPGVSGGGDMVTLYGGSHSSLGGEFTKTGSAGEAGNRLSVSYMESDGYHRQTDYRIVNLMDSVEYGDYRLHAGYMNKEFGAYDFYTPGWGMPSREYNEVFMLSSSARKKAGSVFVMPNITWRRHYDRYILTVDDPDFYENRHTNDVINLLTTLKYGDFSAGGDVRYEYIESTNLGDHHRDIYSVFSEFSCNPAEQVTATAGLRFDDIYIPKLSLSWRAASWFKLRSAWGLSYRRPTFTELYYDSPANAGNKDLDSEKGENKEIGSDIRLKRNIDMGITFYDKRLYDMIDWVGETPLGPWKTENKGDVTIKSVLLSLTYKPAGGRYSVYYAYSDMTDAGSYYSKYALQYLRHRVNLLAMTRIYRDLYLIINLESADPENRDKDGFSIMDIMLKNDFGPLEVFLKLENVTDEDTGDFDGIPSPGRWMTAGVRY